MELKVCEACGAMDTSEDLLTNDVTCLKCGHVSKGKKIDFYGVKGDEKIIKHSSKFNPFQLQQRIKRNNDLSLLK